MTTVCDKCGQPIEIAEWPFCPHGRGSAGIEDVTWPGGITFENLGHEEVTLYSPAELKREMKARGLEPMIRHRDGDPHTRTWATTDPYTLENGRILAERQAQTKASTPTEKPVDPEIRQTVKQVYEELSSSRFEHLSKR